MTDIRTDRDMHILFLKVLREKEKSAREDLDRAKYALDRVREMSQKEEAYIGKEPPGEQSKPSGSDAGSTGT